uniref:Uncharacterized protein MANES_18G064700 n=1 Tax=Rhizophora mucronata TaxID=61149 RepID=A0A2P2L4S2_RHIMU
MRPLGLIQLHILIITQFPISSSHYYYYYFQSFIFFLLFFSVVESVGEHVEEVKEGDMVLPVFAPNCGDCRDCKSSKSNICTRFSGLSLYFAMPRDGTSRFRDMKGQVLHHSFCVSSFTEYTVVDVAHLVKISPDIPLDKACLLSCGVSTGVGAAWKVAGVGEGCTVAIFGLGVVGLAVLSENN